jgi:hypothetical protein
VETDLARCSRLKSDGSLRGRFIDDDRIVDPRSLAVDPKENLLFLNSGADRVLAISVDGELFWVGCFWVSRL